MKTFQWRGKVRLAGAVGRVAGSPRHAKAGSVGRRRKKSPPPPKRTRHCLKCGREGHDARACGPWFTEPYPQIRYVVEFWDGSAWTFFRSMMGVEAWLADVATWEPRAAKRYRCIEMLIDEGGCPLKERQ